MFADLKIGYKGKEKKFLNDTDKENDVKTTLHKLKIRNDVFEIRSNTN